MNPAKMAAMLVVLPLIAGCPRPTSVEPPAVPPSKALVNPGSSPEQPEKMKITAYINVTSGCQAETVALLKKLVADHAAKVDLELIDFGSTEGADRWRQEGLECMTLLFEGSPVLRFPGPEGQSRVVVFSMPAGFSWTHEDLQDAFTAIDQGTLEVLTEEQARTALAPKQVDLRTAVRKEGNAAIVEINNSPVLKITAGAGDKTPMDRAKATQEAIDAWASQPIHPSQLSVVDLDGTISISAQGKPIIAVTKADAKAAGIEPAKQLAVEWLIALKGSVDEASATSEAQSAPAATGKPGSS